MRGIAWAVGLALLPPTSCIAPAGPMPLLAARTCGSAPIAGSFVGSASGPPHVGSASGPVAAPKTLQITAGLLILGLALVALTPTTAVIGSIGAERGMQA